MLHRSRRKEPLRLWGFDRDQCYITSDGARYGTVIMRKVCYQVYICTILGASFQPKNCVLLSWVLLSCYEARRRESHSSPFPLQHLHESYDQPVG